MAKLEKERSATSSDLKVIILTPLSHIVVDFRPTRASRLDRPEIRELPPCGPRTYRQRIEGDLCSQACHWMSGTRSAALVAALSTWLPQRFPSPSASAPPPQCSPSASPCC